MKEFSQNEGGKRKIFRRYYTRNGVRIYPKRAKCFCLFVDSED